MRIAFSSAKDAKNRAKHHLSLGVAARFDWLAGHPAPARTVNGEPRWKMLTDLDGVVYAVVFASPRYNRVWIISVRRASRKERRWYGR